MDRLRSFTGDGPGGSLIQTLPRIPKRKNSVRVHYDHDDYVPDAKLSFTRFDTGNLRGRSLRLNVVFLVLLVMK